MQETRVLPLGGADPLEKEMASYSSVLAWRIPGTGEPGGLPSLGSHRVGHVMCLVTQSCPTLCDPMDHRLPGSSDRGILRQEYWSG